MACGFPETDFWTSTPRLFAAMVGGVREREEAEARHALNVAWWQAHWQRVEKLEPVASYFKPVAPLKKTSAQLMAKIAAGQELAGFKAIVE